MAKVAVIGAGVVGLSTATCIKAAIPDVELTILAKGYYSDTTSYVAAGVSRLIPQKGKDMARDMQTLLRWAKTSNEHFYSLAFSSHSSRSGIYPLGLYLLGNDPIPSDVISQITHGFRPLSNAEIALQPSHFTHGAFLNSVCVENRFYLPYLMNGLKIKGDVHFEQTTVKSIPEIARDFDLVVNCSGLGARELCRDPKMTAIRGQIFRVSAPWIKSGITDTHASAYVYPNMESVVVGGVRQMDNFSTTVNVDDTDDIWKRALALAPSLSGAKVLSQMVGLRPHRHGGIRLETEHLGGGSAPVVHNYGHSGHGVSLSWGTSKHAAELAVQALSDNTNARL